MKKWLDEYGGVDRVLLMQSPELSTQPVGGQAKPVSNPAHTHEANGRAGAWMPILLTGLLAACTPHYECQPETSALRAEFVLKCHTPAANNLDRCVLASLDLYCSKK
jgi:hypothetical protein